MYCFSNALIGLPAHCSSQVLLSMYLKLPVVKVLLEVSGADGRVGLDIGTMQVDTTQTSLVKLISGSVVHKY